MSPAIRMDLSSSSDGPRVGPILPSLDRPTNMVSNGPILVSISDHEGGVVKLPLQGPVQLPLSICERGQISGKDLIEIPLQVDLDDSDRDSGTEGHRRNREQVERGYGSSNLDQNLGSKPVDRDSERGASRRLPWNFWRGDFECD